MNASEVTRCYSLEKGLGTGRIRISLLFRPVEAKLPTNLLGFDTGTLEVRDVSTKSDGVDLSKCEVRMKITTAEAQEKISRKVAERKGDKMNWAPDSPAKLPVRGRYAAALLVSFRDTSGFKTSGRKALGVLWLRDLVDRAEGPFEIALWRAMDGDYSRLKLNYVSPDGDLSYWDSDQERVERVGSIFLSVVFWPGIAEQHYEMLNGQGGQKRSSWDEYDRQKNAGFRDAVGDSAVKAPQDLQAQASHGIRERDGEGGERDGRTDKTLTQGPVDTQRGKDAKAKEDEEGHGANTTVSADSVQVDSDADAEHDQLARDRNGGDESGGARSESVGDGEKYGIVGKVKAWRQHEKELHRDHRGIMQAKPMRTAVWIKDNVEDSAHAVKDRFKMKARQPDIETEV